MNITKTYIKTSTFFLLYCTLAYGQASTSDLAYSSSLLSSPTTLTLPPTPSPAPETAPEYVNLTNLLSVAGPFTTFLKYLETTKLIETLQAQANDTEEGITLFVPKNTAFSKLKKPSLSNLTSDQLKKLCLFHVLPHYYSLSDFRKLSSSGPVNTLAGESYTLNFTDDSGTIHVGSGWTNTAVSSSVHDKDPVAIYQVNKVLLPQAIFGTDIPLPAPAPAPAPAPSLVPDVSPVADAVAGRGKGLGSGRGTSSVSPSSSYRIVGRNVWRALMVVMSGGLMMVL